jgi:AraC family transcriptional regulator of adaptative response / DNA-3-methyladenine glycosylase II
MMSGNRQRAAGRDEMISAMELSHELLDREACYRAFQTHDARFDGRIFVGVTSTGIYCRPICPARVPKFANCRFYASAAGAQEAGFRPCLRCRPEIAPELAFWRGTSNTVSRALKLISEGALDESEAGVEALAERLGVGGRQLRRLFQQHLGASPIAVAQTRRVLFAKQLIHDTRLPMTEVALSAGFGSVRRFNEIFAKMFGRPPSALRRASQRNKPDNSAEEGVTLRLSYRPPYDWPGMLEALAARADRRIEHVEGDVWHRSIELDGRKGRVAVAHLAERHAVAVTIRFPEVRALPAIVARVKRVFDLGADIATIGSHLSRDPRLAPLIARRPGLRAPGDWDHETVGTSLGQDAPPAWRPWHAYAAQHLRTASHG